MIIPDFDCDSPTEKALKRYILAWIYGMGIAHQLHELAGHAVLIDGRTGHIPETDPECVADEILEAVVNKIYDFPLLLLVRNSVDMNQEQLLTLAGCEASGSSHTRFLWRMQRLVNGGFVVEHREVVEGQTTYTVTRKGIGAVEYAQNKGFPVGRELNGMHILIAKTALLSYRRTLNGYLRQAGKRPIAEIDGRINGGGDEDQTARWGDVIINHSSPDALSIMLVSELEPELRSFLRERFDRGPALFEEYFLLITGLHQDCWDEDTGKREGMSGRMAAEYLKKHYDPLPEGCSMQNLAKRWDRLREELRNRFRISIRKERAANGRRQAPIMVEENAHGGSE